MAMITLSYARPPTPSDSLSPPATSRCSKRPVALSTWERLQPPEPSAERSNTALCQDRKQKQNSPSRVPGRERFIQQIIRTAACAEEIGPMRRFGLVCTASNNAGSLRSTDCRNQRRHCFKQGCRGQGSCVQNEADSLILVQCRVVQE
eukprot:scaffold1683_cov125-Isochrysis_galbana.AAC.1